MHDLLLLAYQRQIEAHQECLDVKTDKNAHPTWNVEIVNNDTFFEERELTNEYILGSYHHCGLSKY